MLIRPLRSTSTSTSTSTLTSTLTSTSPGECRQDVLAEQVECRRDVRTQLGEHELLEAVALRQLAHRAKLLATAGRVTRDEQRIDHRVGDQTGERCRRGTATGGVEELFDVVLRNLETGKLLGRVIALKQAENPSADRLSAVLASDSIITIDVDLDLGDARRRSRASCCRRR